MRQIPPDQAHQDFLQREPVPYSSISGDGYSTSQNLLETVELLRLETSHILTDEQRAELGQFFTPAPTAQFMGGLFEANLSSINLLDAGAGVGSLSAAFVATVCSRETKPKTISITAYEVDPLLIPSLNKTLAACRARCEQAEIQFSWRILQQDFIASCVERQREGLFAEETPLFDCAILNPPYRKINSESITRELLRTVGIETTNLYTAFLWLSFQILVPGGELVAITPRSFCNGPYFKKFRKAFLQAMRLRRIHIFSKRNKAFQDDGVLQENIIVHAIKGEAKAQKVSISSSSSAEYAFSVMREVDYDQVVRPSDPDAFIHIVPNELGRQIAEHMQHFTTPLVDLGMQVSTGPVVDFRAKEALRDDPGEDTVPLIWPGHFDNGFIIWPQQKSHKPNALVINAETMNTLVPSDTYVLVKRFSAKEEPRRVVAAIYDPERINGSRVGFENHLNYYHCNGTGLPSDLAKGLVAYLNSTLLDYYFRQFNGHTQVNATDLRSLPYPTRIELETLGSLIDDTFPDQDTLDRLVERELLHMANNVSASRPEQSQERIPQVIAILKDLGLPREQQNERSALTLLALLHLEPHASWSTARNPSLRTRGIMDFIRDAYGKDYAANTRETLRKETLQPFVEAGFVEENWDNPSRPTNSPNWNYRIRESVLELFRSYDTEEWSQNLRSYLALVQPLIERHAQERAMNKIPITLPTGEVFSLSPGGQNVLIEKIINDFCPYFTPGGVLLYVGDTADKWGNTIGYSNRQALEALGLVIEDHGKMPDVVVHHIDKKWLVLIEAVTSHGPVHTRRRDQLKELFRNTPLGLVFVTAFLTRKDMLRYLNVIAWETEVWVAEAKTHMIHFNGERFLGPY